MPEAQQEDHFALAARRHFDDGDYCHKDGRLPTADQLYGFAAECAAKCLLLKFTEVSMEPKDGGTKPSSKPWARHPEGPGKFIEFGHVNELIKEIKLLARTRSGAPLHALLDEHLRAFRKWHVSLRYSDGTYARADVIDKRREAAKQILSLHEQAVITGRLP